MLTSLKTCVRRRHERWTTFSNLRRTCIAKGTVHGGQRPGRREKRQITTLDIDLVIEAHNRFSRDLASAQLTRRSP